MTPGAEAALGSVAPGVGIALLGGFQLTHGGRRVTVSVGSQRLVTFLALRAVPTGRGLVASTLWPDVTESKGYANLRAALTRLDPFSRRALEVTPSELAVADGVTVDLRDARAAALRMVAPGGAARVAADAATSLAVLSSELLPGWYEDWAVFAIEDWHQLRVHALEQLAPALCAVGRLAEGVAAARAAVRADPLRESARAAVMAAYAAGADRCAAIREFVDYEATLRRELGIAPSPRLRAVYDELKGGSDDAVAQSLLAK